MKTRQGFVSNSSSSSFIVAAQGEKNTKLSINIEIDLQAYADKVIETQEDLLDFFLSDLDWEEEELETDEQFQEAQQAIKEGMIILAGNFEDYSDDTVENFLCKYGLSSQWTELAGMIVIQSDGGY